jgi:hypothetical protein
VLEEWMWQRRDPRTHLNELIRSWPEISEDLRLLPGMLHRAIHRKETEDAAAARRSRRVAVRRVRSARLERVVAGSALLIAGAIWAGVAEPVWVGWVGAAIGLMLLLFRRDKP